MTKEVPDLLELAIGVGPAPEGVEQVDHIIAALPAGELTRAAKNSTISYVGLEQIQREKPDLADWLEVTPQPRRSLADAIRMRQQELSGVRRRLATAASVAVLGVGGFVYGYESGKTIHHEVLHPHSDTAQQQAGDRSQGIEVGAISGGLLGTVGGFVVYLSSLSLAGRMARRPAQKLVDKARLSA